MLSRGGRSPRPHRSAVAGRERVRPPLNPSHDFDPPQALGACGAPVAGLTAGREVRSMAVSRIPFRRVAAAPQIRRRRPAASARRRGCRRRAPVLAAPLPAPRRDRGGGDALSRALSGRHALRRQMQSRSERAPRGPCRGGAAFRLRVAGRDRTGAQHVRGRRDPLHAPGQGARRHPRGVAPARRARLRAR